MEAGFPGASLTIILPDDRVISYSSGVSDRLTGREMRAGDRMFSGSTGKTYVSAVLLQLAEEKKLGLSDRVSKFLGENPWFKKIPNHSEINIRHLMNHTSGIPEHVTEPRFAGAIIKTPDKIWQPEELLAFIMDKSPLFPPGEGWFYADTNYILVGMIIEKITGRTYYEALQRRILGPFNLKDTTPALGRKHRGLIQGYTGPMPFGFPGCVVKNGVYVVDPQFEWTGGGLITNSIELARWAKLLYSGKVLKPRSYRELFQAYSFEDGKKNVQGYGLGVQIWLTGHGLVYGHGGIFPGYQSVMKYYPKYDITIAMQVNQDRTANLKLREVYGFVDPFIPLILKKTKR